jgi:hypothetical protein
MTRAERGLLGCLVALCALGCGGEDDDDDAMSGQGGSSSAPAVTFTKDIHPILVAKCGKSDCHNMANTFKPGHGAVDVNVAYESATGTGSLGIPIYERILARVSATNPNEIMPPLYDGMCEGALGAPGCISQAEFDLLQAWVDQGHKK